MATKHTPWWKDELFRYHFTRSTYITSFTDWFMTLAGKSTEFVLYATVLYSCAQLYPGVNLPDKLSLAVFLIQMGSLDIGGLSLSKMAKQAREDGNPEGAKQAETLSHCLIAIMLTGVVTVGIGHVVTMPPLASTIIQIVLVLARSIGSVLYGRVIHALKGNVSESMQVVKSSDVHQRLDEMTTHFQEQLQLIEHLSEHLQGVQSALLLQVQQVVQVNISEAQEDTKKVVQQVVQTEVQKLANEVQTQSLEHAQKFIQLLEENAHTTALSELTGRLQEVSVQVQELSKNAPVEPVQKPEYGGANKPLHLVQSLPKIAENEQANEPLGIRVKRFIISQIEQGHNPTLSEIMNQCDVTKNTAIKYRRELVSDDESLPAVAQQ